MTSLRLRTARTELRPLTAPDVDAAHAVWTDPDVRRYLWDDVVISRERAAEVVAASEADFATRGCGLWGVYAGRDRTLVGFAGIRPGETGRPELLYGLRRSWWGRGLALEAASAVLDHAFDVAGLPDVSASTDVANEPSSRLLARLGMTVEGHGNRHGVPQATYRLAAEVWRSRRVVVRPATAADETLLRSLTPRLADFPRPPWRTAAEIDVSDHRYLFDALHYPREDALVLVAERPAGTGVGMVFVTTQIDYFTQLPHPHVETLAVDARVEGAGVGRALLAAAEAWSAERGYDYVTLTAFDANRRARALYERRGYLPETITYRKNFEAGSSRDRSPTLDPAGLVVRPSEPRDHDALWPILQSVIGPGETYAYPRDLSREAALGLWHPAGGHTFVAELDGRIAGTYLLKANQPGLGSHVANCGYMVAPAARGHGLGEALCRHSLAVARHLGFRAMQFNSVVSTNRTAIAVWQRCGFVIVGTVPLAFAHPVHGLVDIHVMHRFL